MLTHGRGAGPSQRVPVSREQAEELLSLLAELRAHGVEVEAEPDGDRLRLSAAPGALAALDAALQARVAVAKPALLAFLAAPGVSDARRRSRPTRGAGAGRAPLSFAQQRLWLLQQIQPDSSVYNLPYAFRIEGALDAQALSDAVDDLVERHESLRTTMVAGAGGPGSASGPGSTGVAAEPSQRVGPRPRGLLARVDLRAEPQRLAELLELESALPFDLARGPLLRAALIGLGDAEHVLFLNVHHIVCDGWSIEILLDELSQSYAARLRGEKAQLPPLPIQYADFARWERSTVTPATQGPALAFHRSQLAGALAPLELPADHPRPKVFRHRGRVYRFEVEGPLVAALGELGQRHHATTFMVMLAAFKLLLAREAKRRDVVVGTPMAGRLHAETEPLIGFFANTVVLRSSLGDDPSFVDFLGRVRATCLAAYEHQGLPFQWLVDALELPRDSSRTPVFQAMFTFQDTRARRLDQGGLRWTRLDLDSGGSKTDVTLLLEEHEQGMSGWLEYSTELFERATIEGFARRYVALLESIVDGPQQPVSRLDLERSGAHGAGAAGAQRARRATDAPRDPPQAPAQAKSAAPAGSGTPPMTHVVPLSATGGREPLFCFGGLDLYRALARRVAAIRPVSGVVLSSQDADVPALARECVAAVRAQQPHGPYHLAGFAFGGVLAYETAQQLFDAGEAVAMLAMIDVVLPQLLSRAPVGWLRDRVGGLLGRQRAPQVELISTAAASATHAGRAGAELVRLELPRHQAVWKGYRRQLRPWSGPLLVIRARQPRPSAGAPASADDGWGRYVLNGALSVHELRGEHSELLAEPQVEELARVLREHIDAPGRDRG